MNAKRSAKRINNVLNVLSKILRYATEIEQLDRMPKIKTLKVPPQKFDFFTFEELEALIAKSACEPEWHAAVLVAGETGLRLGELLALEWTDIDFKNGLLTVMRNDWRGSIGAPKSGRDRKIPLTTRVTAALKAIRHLKGKLVFCSGDGTRWTNSTMRAGIKRQEKRAGLRVTGWHVLRHSFCSTSRCAARRRSPSRSWPATHPSQSRIGTCTWPPVELQGTRSRCSRLGDRWATAPKN